MKNTNVSIHLTMGAGVLISDWRLSGLEAATLRVQTSLHNVPFQKHEEDLRVRADVFYRRRTGADLTSHDVAEQMNHILLSL